MRHQHFKRKSIAALFFLIFISGNFSAFAQMRRGAAPSKTQTASSQSKDKTCNSGYQGSVNYTKTLSINSTGRHGSYSTTKRTYQANIIVRDDGRPQGSTSTADWGLTGSFNLTGQATASETENFTTLDVSEKDDYCKMTLKGAGDKTRVHCESKFVRQSESNGTSAETNVYIGLQGDKMKISIGRLPKLTGATNETSDSKCSGTCSPQKPINSSRQGTITDGGEKNGGFDFDANIKFNPTSFNRLSGSWSETKPTPGGTVTETLQWNLSRCAPPLEIADVRFEHKKFPSPDKWTGIDDLTGTTDGNIVKIKARVFNNGGDTAYANVKFSEAKSGEALPDAATSVAVKPGEYRDVEYEWDTSGYAWDENRKNASEREIVAALEGGNTEKAKIKIKPKPVIMVHGLWSNAAAWAEYPIYLREAHSFAWNGYAVGADPAHGKMSTGDHPGNYKPTNTIFQNAQELGKQIKFARETNNAWHVDVVAHSMGGLISRQYINAFMAPVWDGKPEIAHLVMLGTPNMGSPCADLVDGLFKFFEQDQMEAMRELRPSVVADFNRVTTNRKNVRFSILIGYAVPRTCQADIRGDGVVPIESARYNIGDRDYVFRDHISLTDDVNFKSFVLPRLAVGPKKARAEQATAWLENAIDKNYALAETAGGDDSNAKSYFAKATFNRGEQLNAADEETVTMRKKVVLAAKQTQEIEIPADAGGVLIVANTGVAAALIDGSGAILGTSEGGTDASKNPFRTIFPNKKASGAMKLKLENFGTQETIVFVAGLAPTRTDDSSFVVEAGKPAADGTVTLTAKLTANNQPVTNANISGKISGQTTDIRFYDDGKHNDQGAGDGIYGATVEKLARGEYFVEATAEINNQTRIAVAPITVGTASVPTQPAAKPAAKPRRGGN